jgi:hypothetical protein
MKILDTNTLNILAAELEKTDGRRQHGIPNWQNEGD